MATDPSGASQSRPRLLDLFCGAGGCSVGYARAGFEVVGVDIAPQSRYAGGRFVQGDALDVLRLLVGDEDDRDEAAFILGLEAGSDDEGFFAARDGGFLGSVDAHHVFHADDSTKPASDVKWFDAIHASPPCQDYSKALRHMASPQPRLIEPVRELLEQTSLLWVIENVEGAPIPSQHTLDGRYGAQFCGTAFGKRVYRHRLFEANWPIHGTPCIHSRHAMNPHNVAGRERMYEEFGRGDPEVLWRAELGVEWMRRYEAREAVPPYFTEHIGAQLLAHIGLEAAA